MRSRIPSFLVACFVATAASASVAPAKDSKALYSLWGKIHEPLKAEAQPIGTYGAGCLAGAAALPIDGAGYAIMRPSRLRYFGHPALVRFIENLGKELRDGSLPMLLVGDLGRPRGGPMPSGHASHQIGLDVDLWFQMSKKRPTTRDRERWNAASYVGSHRGLAKSWAQEQRELVAKAASATEVERVFVNAAIKRDLCEKFPGAPWLYKVRAWWGHGDHLHVRLHCPAGAAGCQTQEPLDPQKLQCGEDLAWWFSKEAEEEGRKKQAAIAGRDFPDLPEACNAMVSELRAGK